MKKLLVILLSIAMMFTMFACGKNKGPEVDPNDPTQQEDYDPTDWTTDEDGNLVNINDPTYIDPNDANYVTKEEREEEKKNQLTLEEAEKIPYVEEEVVENEDDERAENGWSVDDIMSAPLPKGWTCIYTTDDKETKTTGSYKSGDKLIPELSKIAAQYEDTQARKMTSEGMNYVMTMAECDGEIVKIFYAINLNKQRITKVEVFYNSNEYKYKFKEYTFTY